MELDPMKMYYSASHVRGEVEKAFESGLDGAYMEISNTDVWVWVSKEDVLFIFEEIGKGCCQMDIDEDGDLILRVVESS